MRVLVFDKQDRLSIFWSNGARLYQRLGRIDAAFGVTSWDEAFTWLQARPEPITELQYWGHGHWGCALVGSDVWSAGTQVNLPLADNALIWFRTCETFGAQIGQDFAQRLADTTGARVAGHTHIIGVQQSGLHGLAPGMAPDWSATEGLVEGTADDPKRARGSAPWRPNTITCFGGQVPAAWFSTGYRAAAPA